MLSKIAFFLSLNIACFTLTQHANAAGNDGTNPPKDCAPLNTIEDAIKQAERKTMLVGSSDTRGFRYTQDSSIISSMDRVIKFSGVDEHGNIREMKKGRVCDYWRNNERVAIAALSANKSNIKYINRNLIQNNESVAIAALRADKSHINYIGDKLKNKSTKVVKEIICKRIPMELDLENIIHITAATQCIYDKGMGSYMHIIEHAKNITPEQKLALQLILIKYATDKNRLSVIKKLGLPKQEYENLFNHIDQKTLFTIVKYRASFFEFVAPEKQTLPMAVRVIEWDKNMYEHMSENLRNNSIIKKMKNCHEKWFWRFWKREACFEEIKEDYTSQ